MPELPEVEAARRLVAGACVGKRIARAVAADDDKVWCGVPPAAVAAALEGRALVGARRAAKYLLLDLSPVAGDPDAPSCLLLHLGMTGGIAVVDAQGVGSGAHYARYSVEGDAAAWPPRWAKLELEFADGARLAFADSRRFGRARLLAGDPFGQPPLDALGAWDPLSPAWPAAADFAARLRAERRPIKALLLDQKFTPGVGNWVADEALYQARVHPEQPARSLSGAQAAALHRWVKEVCAVASDAGAEAGRFPDDWLFPHRWAKGKAGTSRVSGRAIAHVTVGGRTSAFVPELQRLDKAAAAAAKGCGKGKAAAKGKKAVAAAEEEDAEDEEEAVVEAAAAAKRVKRAAPAPAAAEAKAAKKPAAARKAAAPRAKAPRAAAPAARAKAPAAGRAARLAKP
jgi:formamidopyrimidine-DNA glycosylase